MLESRTPETIQETTPEAGPRKTVIPVLCFDGEAVGQHPNPETKYYLDLGKMTTNQLNALLTRPILADNWDELNSKQRLKYLKEHEVNYFRKRYDGNTGGNNLGSRILYLMSLRHRINYTASCGRWDRLEITINEYQQNLNADYFLWRLNKQELGVLQQQPTLELTFGPYYPRERIIAPLTDHTPGSNIPASKPPKYY